LPALPPKALHFAGREGPDTGDGDEMGDENLISKTRRKRQMHELQEIGVALTRLRTDQLARIEMPDDLREAVVECRKMTKHEAIRRQLQYIGRVMRELDTGSIAAQLDAMHAPTHRQTALFHRAERWRSDILADPKAIERFAGEFPGADPRRLRELAAAALAERQAEQAPKRYRELFQVINAILQDPAKHNP
jgi:ribosome-associated protein